MQTSEPLLPIYDFFCHHEGDKKYLLVLKSTEPSHLKTALILCVNYPTCYCYLAFEAPLHGRIKRPLAHPKERFAKYLSAMLYTGFSVPNNVPRHRVLESIYAHWDSHLQELRHYYNSFFGLAVSGVIRQVTLPSTSNAVQRKPPERKGDSDTDDTDSDALYIDESAESNDEDDANAPRGVSVEDGSELYGGQQVAKPMVKPNGDNVTRTNLPKKSEESSADGHDTKRLPSKTSFDTSGRWPSKKRREVVDQKVQLLFESYLEFMIGYAAKNKLRKITMFEMTTKVPPKMKKMTQNRKRQCTGREKDHLFEDED